MATLNEGPVSCDARASCKKLKCCQCTFSLWVYCCRVFVIIVVTCEESTYRPVAMNANAHQPIFAFTFCSSARVAIEKLLIECRTLDNLTQAAVVLHAISNINLSHQCNLPCTAPTTKAPLYAALALHQALTNIGLPAGACSTHSTNRVNSVDPCNGQV